MLKLLKPLLVTTALIASLTAATVLVGVGGKTEGRWDLPTFWQPGSAAGVLYDQNGAAVFRMSAKVSESPSADRKTRVGTFSGSLDNGGPVYPQYGVSGSWKAERATGAGGFDGVITKQISPLGPIAIVGKIVGDFKDSPYQPGKYVGEWKADI